MASSTEQDTLIPVRMTINLCLATTRAAWDRGDHFDQIHDALEGLPHVFNDGGHAEIMVDGDVIEGGPLDLYLKGA